MSRTDDCPDPTCCGWTRPTQWRPQCNVCHLPPEMCRERVASSLARAGDLVQAGASFSVDTSDGELLINREALELLMSAAFDRPISMRMLKVYRDSLQPREVSDG